MLQPAPPPIYSLLLPTRRSSDLGDDQAVTTLLLSARRTVEELARRRPRLVEELAEVQASSREMERQIAATEIELGDRKSTRLNSSHLGISYAVFCLKKKKHVM